MSALRGLLRKEFFHIRRDRRTAAVLVALPVVQVLLFGYAIRTDVDDVRLAVVDPAPDSATIALRNRFTASERVPDDRGGAAHPGPRSAVSNPARRSRPSSSIQDSPKTSATVYPHSC